MKKLLGLLGSLGLVSTSATAVVSFVKIPKDNDSKTIDKAQLEQLINEAKKLATENQDKNNEAYQALHKAIGEANGVLVIYQNETENPGVLKEAHEKLAKAMNTFTGSVDTPANTVALVQRIKDANKILTASVNNSKSKEDKERLQVAITAAETLKAQNLKISEQDKVNAGVQTLQTATLAFFNAADQPANTAELKAEIANAKKALETEKAFEAMEKLKGEIALAEEVIKANYSSSDEGQKIVDDATARLKQAIKDYANAGQPVLPDDHVDLKALRDKIKEAKDVASDPKRKHKPLSERIKIEEAIGHAEGIIAGKPVVGQEKEIQAEVTALQTAMDTFINEPNQKAELHMLDANIKLAKGVDKTKKKPDTVKTFEAAIKAAEILAGTKPDIDKQGDIDKGAETIWQATLTFLNSANKININHVIYNGLKLDGVFKNLTDKKAIGEQIKKQFPNVTDTIDFSIGTVKQANKDHKSNAEITGIGDYQAITNVYFVLDLKFIEKKLNDIVNTKKDAAWTAAELKAEIEKNNLDVKDGLKVTQIDSKPNLELAKFKITTNNHYDYSGYQGEVIITQGSKTT
ncbi:lipoprotein [Williamsoniiplasma lucivorax]|uniref:Uncharacterized protein n=1 Tax=Williamsoniiplasma lucivorax TaxID=209274 RepID=A0A2S5RCU0_9MOLU|nr:lipoprotein [Williamsoniiplasma lucivorax]PPE05134.1 hypothetical protein ELUCI_v1c06700 [Williamsoniiplasma lucivorax]